MLQEHELRVVEKLAQTAKLFFMLRKSSLRALNPGAARTRVTISGSDNSAGNVQPGSI